MQATQDGWAIVESSDKLWSMGGSNVNSLQHSCLKKPTETLKRQKDMTPEDEPPGGKVSGMLLGKS